MAVRACNTRILVNEYDLSGTTNGITVGGAVDTIDYGVLQTCTTLRIPTSPAITITHNGYFNGPSAGAIENELYTDLGTTGIYVTAIADTAGAIPVAYTLDTCWNETLVLDGPVAGLIACNGSWVTGTAGSQCYRGYQVYRGTLSATGGATGIDFGAAGTAGGKAYLHVTTITGGATDATIDVESDTVSNFASAASEGTFTFSAVGAYTIDLADTVNRYVRVNCTDLGTATSFAVVCIVALSGVTY